MRCFFRRLLSCAVESNEYSSSTSVSSLTEDIALTLEGRERLEYSGISALIMTMAMMIIIKIMMMMVIMVKMMTK